MDPKTREWVGFIVSAMLLLAYATIAGNDLWSAWTPPPKPAIRITQPIAAAVAADIRQEGENQPRSETQAPPPTPTSAGQWIQYLWTSISVLVGAVVTIALGLPSVGEPRVPT